MSLYAGAGVERVPGKLPHEEVLGERVVVEPVSGAKDRARASRRIPGGAHPRRHVVPVLVVERGDRRDTGRGGVEDAEAVVALAQQAVVVPAHAAVQRDEAAGLEAVLQVERVVVLEGEPPGIPLGLPAAGQPAGHEVLQAVEVEPAAIPRVEETVDRRPSELVARLPVVPSGVVRHVREQLRVGVHAAARQRQVRARVREPGDPEERQPEVLRIADGVEPDRPRIERAVLGEEVLGEAIEAAPHFQEELRREEMREGTGDEVDGRRRVGVVAGEDAAAEQAEREALVAVAEEVPHRQEIRLADVLVDLPDHAVDTVAEGRGRLQVVAVLVRRLVGGGPGLPFENAAHDRVERAAIRRHCRRKLLVGRHACETGQPAFLPLPLVGSEEERAVLPDRPAERAAELVVAERVLRGRLLVEEVAGSQGIVAEVLVDRASQVIGARPGDDVDDGAGVAAVFGLGAGEHRELGHGIDGKHGGGGAENAGLVDGRQVPIPVVHVGAVEQIVVGAAAVAVDAEEAEGAGGVVDTAGVGARPGNQRHELHEVASVERDLRGLLPLDGSALDVARRVDKRRPCHHLHRLLDAARLHLHVNALAGRGHDLHALDHLGRKPRQGCGQVVHAQRQFREEVVAGGIGRHRPGEAGAGVRRGDGSSGHGCAGLIGDGTLDGSPEGLRGGWRDREQGEREGHSETHGGVLSPGAAATGRIQPLVRPRRFTPGLATVPSILSTCPGRATKRRSG